MGCLLLHSISDLHQLWHSDCFCSFCDSPFPKVIAVAYASHVASFLNQSTSALPPQFASPKFSPWLHNQLFLASKRFQEVSQRETAVSTTLYLVQHVTQNSLSGHLSHICRFVDLLGSDINISDGTTLPPSTNLFLTLRSFGNGKLLFLFLSNISATSTLLRCKHLYFTSKS